MQKIFSQIAILFALVLLGFIINKLGVFDEVSDKKISSLLINVTLPATVLASAFSQSSDDKMSALTILCIAAVIFLLMPLFASLFTRITGSENTYKLIVTYPNLGFMGMPIMNVLYGSRAVFYTSLFMIIFNISVFSYGVATAKGENGFDIKKLINPGIISAILALAVFLLDIPCPETATEFLSSVGGITSPLAMMVIGSNLARVNFREMLKDVRLYLVSVYKLIVIPFIIWLVLHFIIDDKMIVGLCVILMSLPVAGNVSMLCITYGANTQLSAKATCMTTVLSLLTIPVYMLIFAV